MFGISGPVPVETVWQHKLADKNAFKEFAHGKIQNYYSEKLKSKIQRSSSLRFIHEDDFDFRDKKLHPLITTAYTKKEVVAMKINILHLIGEYKCGSNLFRICVKKTPASKYCKDDNDTSEHVLLHCKVVTGCADIQRQLDCIVQWLSNEKVIPKEDIISLIQHDYKKFTSLLINPTSAGNPSNLRIEKDHKFICILIRKLQLYQLLCHNARSRSGKIKNVPTKPSGVVLSSKVGKGRAMFGRKLAPAASSMNKISRYFFKSGSNNTNQAAENELQASGLTYTDEDRIRIAGGGKSFG